MSFINNPPNINETFILEPIILTADTSTISACTAVYTNRVISCDGDATIFLGTGKIEVNSSIIPLVDAANDLGIAPLRFRNVNTVSGSSTVWSSSEKVITPVLDLGYDSQGFHRVLTADSSILQNDILNGGVY